MTRWPSAPRRVLIAHNAVAPDADPSTADVLEQAGRVERALDELAVLHTTVAVEHGRVWEALVPEPGDVVFNLMEAPPAAPHLQPACAAILEVLGVSFTGSRAGPMWLTTDKLATRALLAARGLPVAAGGTLVADEPELFDRVPGPWILKPAWEDASVGLDGEPVCATPASARERGEALSRRFPGQPILIEHFLPGREFNVSLLGGPAGVEALPVAEIAFVDFPPGVPALVGYEAKWASGSFAETHTVRVFPEDARDVALLRQVRELAAEAWRAAGVAGYARVDMRLDEAGDPCILEVNANPCLSPDAGFLAAAARAGVSQADVVRRILDAARRDVAR